MKKYFEILKKQSKKEIRKLIYSKKQKIFCLGRNKTGTTSIAKAMQDLGFQTGNQREAELMFDDWVKRDFRRIINYCKTAEFFQDVPFSLPYTFIALDQAFPGSKYILTIRNSPEEWYNSFIRFAGKIYGNGNIPPTAADLKNAKYIYKGRAYHVHNKILQVDDNNLYDKSTFINHYLLHNKIIKEYFRHRQEDLLTLNIGEKNSYQKLCNFLHVKSDENKFPWENKTDDIVITNKFG